MASPVITLILDAKNLASPQLKSLQRDLKKAETNTTKMDAAMGRAGMVAKGLLVGGIAAVGYAAVNYLGDAVQAAKEEEIGIARLGAALRANVPDWEAQGDAIERGIQSRVRLGFADDEVRDSLAKLVPVTHDVGAAFDIMSTAEDLARFKGIGLVEASEALVKVEAGQYRMLKSLGIVLKDGATATEALAEVQRVAGGQAEAYMETLAGKTEELDNRLEDLQEEIGRGVTPALSNMSGALLDVIHVTEGAEVPITNLTEDIANLAGALQTMGLGFGWVEDMADGVSESARMQEAAGAIITSSMKARTALRTMGDAAKGAGDDIKATTRKIKLSFGSVTDYLLGEYNADFDRAMGIQEARADLHNAESDADRAQAYQDLAELGALSKKDMDNWTKSLERLVATTRGKTRQAYQDALAEQRKYRAALSVPIDVTVNYRRGGNANPDGSGGWGGHASGGWVGTRGPELTWVGESGPEYIVPNHDLGGPSGGRVGTAGGGGITLVVNSAWPPTPAQAREFADMLDAEWAQRRPRYSPA